jgi:type III restriction enzyme
MPDVLIENPILNKEAKVETARRLWVLAINNDGRFGRWAFLETQDPWNAQTEIRKVLADPHDGRAA